MTHHYATPGVYIEEFTPGAPIEGVGTSTAAFLGPCKDGSLNEPTKITSWDQFCKEFGDEPLTGFYLWYAVRGFFKNEGTVCYVTRVSNAKFAELTPKDNSGKDTIRIYARKPGIPSPDIKIEVSSDVHAVDKAQAKMFRPTATIVSASDTTILVSKADEAAQFRNGDILTWTGSNEKKPVRVFRVEDKTIRLIDALSNNYNAGTLRLADLKAGDTIFRVENASKLGAGSVIKLEQGSGASLIEDTQVVRRVEVERITPLLTTYRVELRQGLKKDFDMSINTTIESFEFKLTVSQGNSPPQVYDELGMDPEHVNYFSRVVRDDQNGLIFAEPVEPPNTTLPPDNRPGTLSPTSLTGGANDSPTTLSSTDYKKALSLLESIDDVNMVAMPDRTDEDVQLEIVDHCKKMKYRFAILDSRRGAGLFGTNSVEVQRKGLDSEGGYAALYYPWLQVSDAKGTGFILVPPSGHIAGIYARIDAQRGVHKAPAGNEALVKDALGVERTMSDIDQGQLNLQGINVIRVFTSGGRPVVWGARTTATDKNWQYVNIRRLFSFIEKSTEIGIRGAVFEVNNLRLWQRLKRTITEFLTRVWRDGALFGKAAEDAFYVRIDDTLNPPSTQALGRLYIEIGVRPAYPAEFIIVRIGIWQGGSEITMV